MKAANATTDIDHTDRQLTTGGVVLELMDTTWRIAVPVLIFACLGIFADIKLGTKPFATLLAVMAGFFVAAKLVKRQINAIEISDARALLVHKTHSADKQSASLCNQRCKQGLANKKCACISEKEENK